MRYFSIFALCVFFLLTGSAFSQGSSSDSTSKFRLEIGAGLGVAAGCFSYLSMGGNNGSITTGTSTDLLNEYTIYGLAKFSKYVGVGLEFGRLTHFELIGGVRTYDYSGFPTTISVSEYISGMYFAPFVRVGQISVGATFMTPTAGTYFARAGGNVSTDADFEDLDTASQNNLKSAMQTYINVFGRYDHDVTNISGFPSTIYGKLGFNVQHPIDYGKFNELKSHVRLFLTVGASLHFNLIK
ncbi:MAG: hypothetical protein HYZ54_01830 [Ignavibacteriae bacterium]|nr:hypothetical protein [Ignavibacteriota bacterium]